MTGPLTVVEGSSVRVQTMADGTLRIVVDVHPTKAVDAFRLFGSPGQPMALCALKDGHAAVTNEPPEKLIRDIMDGKHTERDEAGRPLEKPKGGPLSQTAARICREETFHKFSGTTDEATAANYIRWDCNVKSRAELDHDIQAQKRFHTMMAEYRKFLYGQ